MTKTCPVCVFQACEPAPLPRKGYYHCPRCSHLFCPTADATTSPSHSLSCPVYPWWYDRLQRMAHIRAVSRSAPHTSPFKPTAKEPSLKALYTYISNPESWLKTAKAYPLDTQLIGLVEKSKKPHFLSSPSIKECQQKTSFTFMHQSFEKVTLPKESLDAIVMGEDLNQNKRPAILLEKAFFLLKPGGALIVEMPVKQGILSRFSQTGCLHYAESQPHYFQPRSLRYAAETSGFSYCKREYLCDPNGWTASIANRLMPKKKETMQRYHSWLAFFGAALDIFQLLCTGKTSRVRMIFMKPNLAGQTTPVAALACIGAK